MGQGKYISIFVFVYLVFCPLADGFGEALGSELSCQQISAMKEQKTEAEHATVPSDDTHPLKNITKRRTDPATPLLVTFSFPIPARDQVVRLPHHSSTENTYQAAPLYQSLQVYRF
jgi:hypothetical protein